jgi:catechol 2,3-dioxygenase-like lactoylglutathione lyase family enzyme
MVLVLAAMLGAYSIPEDVGLKRLVTRDLAASGAGEVTLSDEYQRRARIDAALGGFASLLVIVSFTRWSRNPGCGHAEDRSEGATEMLRDGRVATRLPAQSLERARAFYAEKLGLEPVEERDGGLRYVCASGEFALFESAGRASGNHTQMGWEVGDIDATVRELRARGVVFEEYDFPGLKTVDGIADIEGNYPSKGSGERAAWFRDSEGNMLGIGQPTRG